MSKPLILLLGVVVFLATAAWAIYYFTTEPPAPTPRIVKYGGSARDFIAEFFNAGHDSDKNGELSYEEFAKGYADFQLNKSEREVYDAKEAFAMLDANRDGVLDSNDIEHFDKRRKDQEDMKRREAMAKEGLQPLIVDGKEIICNVVQRSWSDLEGGAAKRGEIPFGGMYFELKWFGDWEEIKRPGLFSLWRQTSSTWARVTLADGRAFEAFVRETKDEAQARKLGLTPGKVYTLGTDARMNAYAVDKVASIDYSSGSPQALYVKAVAAAALSDKAAQLELARQCAKDGLEADSKTLYKRVLLFEFDNAEALAALGYKLNGKQYVKVN